MKDVKADKIYLYCRIVLLFPLLSVLVGCNSDKSENLADGNTPPMASITVPPDGTTVLDGSFISFTGTANDAEDGILDASLTWTSDGSSIGSGASIATTLPVGTHSIVAMVTDSGGLTTASTPISVTVNPVTGNTPPTASITAPLDGTTVVDGSFISFTGTANDAEDGILDASLAWTSDGNSIGFGASITTTLTLGTHTIVATVTDSGGLTTLSAPITVTVDTVPVGGNTGLDFQSNSDTPTDAYIAFEFDDPHLNGLPAFGPSGQGATYMWKIKPAQQNGYYVTMWWTQGDGGFGGLSDDIYYGAHPYPNDGVSLPPLTSVGTHNWELATDNNDWQITKAGIAKPVVKGVWYTQALKVVRNSSASKVFTFYTALPSVDDADVIEVIISDTYGETTPPSPKLIFGDSPWYESYQHERLSGVLRGIKIFNKALSESDIVAESASDSLVTAEGLTNIWYMNINPTPNDISDKSGKGNNPTWASSVRPLLYTSP